MMFTRQRELGILLPAASGEFIAKHSQQVKINEEGVEKLANTILKSFKDNKLEIPDTGSSVTLLDVEDPRAPDWIFVVDSLNFCFWSYKGQPKWTVDNESGYVALEAAMMRALKTGHDITNPEYYSQITPDQMRQIMRSDNGVDIPLFDKRIEILHEVGATLLKKHKGSFKNCILKADKSALKLLDIILEDFPSFRDEAAYNNQLVGIYKRAQILVADIWNFYEGKLCGEFKDIDKLTMFADYRLPQMLVYYGALSYSDELMMTIASDKLLECGSPEEVEIRGCSIHAVELLKKKLATLMQQHMINAKVPNSCIIDYYIWCLRRKHAEEVEQIPFHKTLGIFY